MEAEVEVVRAPDLWPDRFRRYTVLIDGAEAGSVAPGGSFVGTVGAGQHEVRMTIDWCGSEAVFVDVEPGQTARLICRSNIRLRWVFLLPLYVTIWRNRYIALEKAE